MASFYWHKLEAWEEYLSKELSALGWPVSISAGHSLNNVWWLHPRWAAPFLSQGLWTVLVEKSSSTRQARQLTSKHAFMHQCFPFLLFVDIVWWTVQSSHFDFSPVMDCNPSSSRLLFLRVSFFLRFIYLIYHNNRSETIIGTLHRSEPMAVV